MPKGGELTSQRKLGMDDLLKRIDELLNVINLISRDLLEVSKALREVSVPAVPPERIRGIEDIRKLFPKDLEKMLEFEETEEFFVIRPLGFLGTDIFAKIASIVRDAGGEYVSAGKKSHFRIFK